MKTRRRQYGLDFQFQTRQQFLARVTERSVHLCMLTAATSFFVTFVASVALVAFSALSWTAITGWFVAGVIASAGLAHIVGRAYYTIVAWRDL